MRRILTVFLFSAGVSAAGAQDTLSLTEALAVGLEQNYALRVQALSQEVQQVALDNARLLNYVPELAIDGGVNNRTQNVNLTFASGDEQVRPGANTLSANANATLSYRIYEGNSKTYRILALGLSVSEMESTYQAAIETTAADIHNTYYALVVAQNQGAVLATNLQISRERVSLAKAQYEVGKASKLEFLQAQVDYNTDSAQWLAQQEVIQSTVISLNQLMGGAPMAEVVVARNIPLDTTLDYAVLVESLGGSPTLEAQNYRIRNARVAVDQAGTGWLPTLDATAGYGYNYSNAEAGFVLQNRTSGVSAGVTGRWSLSGALAARQQQEQAKILLEQAELSREQLLLALESELARVFASYQNQQAALALEAQNVSVARENATIALDRYRLGISNALQLREAQRNLVQAESRLLNVRFRIKQAEIELLRLSGLLWEG